METMSTAETEYWETAEAVAKYTGKPELLLGEELAFASCFADGWQGKPVLDLGCGGGRTTYFLERMGAEVVGVDISRPLVAAARERCPAARFCVGDAKALNFRNDSFDAVLFSFNSLDCLEPKSDREACIAEIWRVLRPGGRLILSHHNLAGLLFSWYRNLHPRKLWFRARHILNGDVFHAECYLPDRGSGGLDFYYAWPSKFISDLEAAGFRLLNIYPNSRLLWSVQRTLRTAAATKLADPWPYYVFARPSNGQGARRSAHRASLERCVRSGGTKRKLGRAPTDGIGSAVWRPLIGKSHNEPVAAWRQRCSLQ